MMGFFSLIKRFIKRLRGGKSGPAEGSASQKADDNPERFRGPSEKNIDNREAKEEARGPRESKYIAVVGLTGSGLSQFIHDVTGKYGYGVASSSSVSRYTKEITPVEACIGERDITLIDTPGFVYSSDGGSSETLTNLVNWVKEKNVKLDGIIYMHDIRNKEILSKHWHKFNLPEELEKLCGYSKVMFVTSRWNELESYDEGVTREKKFEEGYWKLMKMRGSPMRRYECMGNGQARKILESLWE